MGGKKDKLVERFLTFPNDFTIDEFDNMMFGFGVRKSSRGKTSGSVIAYVNSEKSVFYLHTPHPQKTIKRPYLKKAEKWLRDHGHID